MPIFSRHWLTQTSPPAPDPEALRVRGPALDVEVMIPDALASALEQAQLSLPTPHVGMALIDTGASISAVDEGVLIGLGLTPTGTILVTTPSGVAEQPLYDCEISFPGTPIPTLPFNSVAGSQLAGLGYSALIGRDVLRHCQLVYNGAEGFWTLAF